VRPPLNPPLGPDFQMYRRQTNQQNSKKMKRRMVFKLRTF